MFVLIFKTYGPNMMRSRCLERQNKYFPYGPSSWLIRLLSYTYKNKTIQDETDVTYCVRTLPGRYAYLWTGSQPIRSQNSFHISISIQLYALINQLLVQQNVWTAVLMYTRNEIRSIQKIKVQIFSVWKEQLVDKRFMEWDL